MYELSWLNQNGLPQVAIGQVEINAASVNLVESKSFKLYLNSFNQTRFASLEAVRETLERDLRACAQGEVSVTLRRLDEVEGEPVARFDGECIDNQDLVISSYDFDAALLSGAAGDEHVEETLVSHLLKSNCLSRTSRTGLSTDPLSRAENLPRKTAALSGLFPSSQRIPRAVRRAHL